MNEAIVHMLCVLFYVNISNLLRNFTTFLVLDTGQQGNMMKILNK